MSRPQQGLPRGLNWECGELLESNSILCPGLESKLLFMVPSECRVNSRSQLLEVLLDNKPRAKAS